MQHSFFEVDDCYNRLDKAGDPLLKLSEMINWKSLLPLIKSIHFKGTAKGGRPGIGPLIIIKCILLQSLYNISDDSCEYQINDRLSFKRFIGLSTSQKAPDAKTIWLYKERIKWKKLHDKIFNWFDAQIEAAGYTAQEGQIVDASFVPTHKPTGKHKKQLKEEIPLTKAQSSQIDNDATFTKKNEKTFHGYKNHIQIDNKHKLIRQQITTTASLHDSQEFENLVDENNDSPDTWADSAYRSAEIEEMLKKKNLNSKVHERAYRNNLLSKEQKANNTVKSKTRVRVEHIFGHMVTSMGGVIIHTIGIARAEVKVTFKNIAYNMQRFIFLESKRLTG